ncbi:MAG TPA: septal ring lytic transglycosylase RlpA family protein [Candidatus Saccharimonadales bacterium]|nr:septal ring lytic transglycosylase RlpA family protein [Candidatus Saccharimonadales bacterium]
MLEPALRTEPPQARPKTAQPKPDRGSITKQPKNVWRRDPEISWYGPGLIGNGTACGQTLTRTLVGVAHRSLPCGSLVTFRAHGHTLTVPVVDRGPFVSGRIFDLTYAACKKLEHCYTGPIQYRMGRVSS